MSQGDWSDSSKKWDSKEGKAVPSGPKAEDGRFWMEVRETVLLPHFLTKHDRLPRQARDERAE